MSDDREPKDLLRQGAKLERQLLRDEQRAERAMLDAEQKLASAERKLEKARERLERRREQRSAAAATLRTAQAARAAGPNAIAENRDGAIDKPSPVKQPEPETRKAPPERDDTGLPARGNRRTKVAADDEEPSDPRPTRRRKPRPAKTDAASST